MLNISGKIVGLLIFMGIEIFAVQGLPPGTGTLNILTMPFGSRQIAMGEVGAATAFEESAVFWNPALLGVTNPRWQNGALTYQFEKPFPLSFASENRHSSIVGCIQSPDNDYGTFALSANIQNWGFTKNNYGSNGSNKRIWEGSFALTYGFDLHKVDIDNHLFGITTKFIHSQLFPQDISGGGTGRTIAFDIGYSWLISPIFTLGFSALNMGSPLWYLSSEEAEPLPFNANLAVGFSKDISSSEWLLNHFVAEYKLSRYFANIYLEKRPDPFYKAIFTSWSDNTAEENWRSFLHNFGYELTLLKHFHLRQGFFIDPRFNDAEMHWGFGGTMLNHFNFDFHHIYSPKTTEYRHGQWGITFSVFNL